jgi:signal transduction histidine kinase
VEGVTPGYEVEVRLLHCDGSDVWVAVRASVVRNDSGRALYVLQIIEDIREVREAETARREIDQLKDRFLRVVSHDLQNPLLTITHLANLVDREPCGVEIHHEAARRIAAQAARLQHMVARFLDLERLYHGSVVSARRATDIAALVSRVVQHCDASEHPVAVEVAPLVAAVDPDQVEHILENLLENAICHTPPDTPIVVRIDETYEGLHIRVEDAGPGVPDHLKESVFELFRTGEPAVVRTGVGLWIVVRFAELHGGRAWVEDRPGGGASFHVFLQVPPEAPPLECLTMPGTAGAIESRGRR